MALTAYNTTGQRTAILDAAIASLRSARQSCVDAEALSAKLIAAGYDTTSIWQAVSVALGASAMSHAVAITQLGELDDQYPYQNRVVIGCPGEYTACAIDSGGKTFTATGGTPFAVFAQDDIILVTHAEDAANKKVLTVVSVVGNVMTVAESVTSNASDTKLQILHLKKYS